jgi:hypothetical protein
MRTTIFLLHMMVVLLLSGNALAEKSPLRIPERFAFDVGFETSHISGSSALSYYSRDSLTGAERSALLFVDQTSWSFGLGLDSSYRIRPWLSVGLDTHVQHDADAPHHAWFNRLGLRLGSRTAFSIGPFVEFLPLTRAYATRRGLYVRLGVRELWFERPLSRSASVVSPQDGSGRDVQGWLGLGYRVAVGEIVSLHFMLELARSIDLFEVRFRVGTGYR